MTPINAKRLPPNEKGVSGWYAISVKPDIIPLNPDITKADIIIIGAGFAGLSAAARALEIDPKAKIIILEATHIGASAAGRNSGFMIDLPHDIASDNYGGTLERDRHNITINRYAIDFARHLATLCNMDKEVFNPCGKINGAATEKGMQHNADYAKHLQQLGEECEILDAKQMQDICNSPFYKGGLHTKGSVIIQPASYIQALAHYLSQSVTIFQQTPLISLTRNQHLWQAHTKNTIFSAPNVIMAVNGLIEDFGFFKKRLLHIALYGSMTRALTQAECTSLGNTQSFGITPSDPMGTTVRFINSNQGKRLVLRNHATFTPNLQVSHKDMQKAATKNDIALKKRYPLLAHVDMEYRWAGRLCLSHNNVAAFGELEQGLISACCQNGLGTVKGTMAGMAAADLCYGQTSIVRDYLQQQEAPKKLPPEPFLSLGAKSTIAWQAFKARHEL